MQTEQLVAKPGEDFDASARLGEKARLALVFASAGRLREPDLFERIRRMYPKAIIFGCSTAGEIAGARVLDESVTVTAVSFDAARLALTRTAIEPGEDSLAVGARLAAGQHGKGLRHLLVLSDGLMVNGSRLVRGLAAGLPAGAMQTGGLAANGEQFRETLVVADAPGESKVAAALGFYGEVLRIGCGSAGGWDIFGPKRVVTRSRGNVLYELDGKPVLDLYKRYLGPHVANLPASALLFPLSVEPCDSSCGSMVRTVLRVDERERSMTFAGDIPEGALATLMYANFDRLVEGAADSARQSRLDPEAQPHLALCISCVGRKLILKQRVEEETEAVAEVLGEAATIAGFYSYGEIAPMERMAVSELHNQTMTITTIAEA